MIFVPPSMRALSKLTTKRNKIKRALYAHLSSEGPSHQRIERKNSAAIDVAQKVSYSLKGIYAFKLEGHIQYDNDFGCRASGQSNDGNGIQRNHTACTCKRQDTGTRSTSNR